MNEDITIALLRSQVSTLKTHLTAAEQRNDALLDLIEEATQWITKSNPTRLKMDAELKRRVR